MHRKKDYVARIVVQILTLVLLLSPLLTSISALSVTATTLADEKTVLFKTTAGQGTIQVQRAAESSKINWQLTVKKEASEAARYYSLSIKQNNQTVIPINLEGNAEFGATVTETGEIFTDETSKEEADLTFTFETEAGVSGPFILQSALWEVTPEGKQTDLLEDEPATEISIPRLEQTEENVPEKKNEEESAEAEPPSEQAKPERLSSYRNQLKTTIASGPTVSTYAQYVTEASYLTDSLGHYPKNSWRLHNQESVKNYVGNQNNAKKQEPAANYIFFGEDQQHPDFKIRKYASATTTPGLYDIYLNVTGNTNTITTPTDIVFVVDHSSSMTQERLRAVKSGVGQFVANLKASKQKEQYRVGLTLYGGNDYRARGADLMPVKNQKVTDIVPLAVSKNQGTFTQKGLRDGAKLLLDTPNPNSGLTPKKVLVLLTDGVPTYTYKINQLSKMENLHDSGYKATAYTSDRQGQPIAWGNGTSAVVGKNTSSTQYGDNRKYSVKFGNQSINIRDHFLGTLSEADDVKRSNIEIHSVGIQISGDDDFSAAQVETYMKRMASQGADGKFYYNNSQTSAQIVDYLEKISNRFTNSVANGVITDPLSDMVLLNSRFEPTVKSVGTNKVTQLPEIEYANPHKTFNLSNINLAENQEIEFHYQVRLDTENPKFKADYFYPANERTTFSPKNTSESVDFGVPSIKAPGVNLTVEKVWQGDELVAASSRPSEVRVGLIQSKVTGERRELKELTLNETMNWHQEINHLPAFDNQGNAFGYTVVEKAVDENYQVRVTETGTGDYTITNTLKTRDVLVEKHGNQERHLLAGAKFQLYRKQGPTSSFERVSDKDYVTNEVGQVSLKNLPVGEYLLKETQAPAGYQLAPTANLSFAIKNQGGRLVLMLTSDSQGINHKDDILLVKNELKDFDLTIYKKGGLARQELAGARFKLRSKTDTKFQTKELTSDQAGKLVFKQLKPGTYVLSEVKAPAGYRLLTEPLEWKITDDGQVKLLSDNQLFQQKDVIKTEKGNNQLSFTVINHKLPLLPNTGSYGMLIIVFVGLMFISLGLYVSFRLQKGQG